MAVPHVAGAAALVLSVCELAPAKLKALLLGTVDPVAALTSTTVSHGRLNVGRALQSCTGAAADFAVSSAPSSKSVVAGGSASYSVTLTPLGGFTDTASFAVSGLPGNAAVSFAPPTVTTAGMTTMTVTTGGSTPAGTYPLRLTATSGAITHTTSVSLIVQPPPPDFTISATPSSRTVSQSSTTSYTATISPLQGFKGTVVLTAGTLPAGVTATLGPPTIPGTGSSNVSVRTSASTPRGTYTLTVTGTSGTITHSTTMTMIVTGNPPDFTVTPVGSASQQVPAGRDATFQIGISPLAGFSGPVALTTNTLSNGTTTALSPAIVNLNGTTTATASLVVHTAAGKRVHYDVIVTAAGGGITHTLHLNLDAK